jgi:hypothetical protein
MKPHFSLALAALIILALLPAAGAQYAAPPRVTFQTIPATTTPVPSGALSVESVPAGATLFIDGVRAGVTPYTIRTLAEGSHSLTLQMAGYLDITDTVMIARDRILEKTYTLTPQSPTLLPVTTVPPIPRATVLPVTTAPPATGALTAGDLLARIKFKEPVFVRPITITVGNRTKQPILTTDSPYLRFQIENQNDNISLSGTVQKDFVLPPTTFVEVDKNLVYTQYLAANPGSGETCSFAHQCPIWDDNALYLIKPTDKYYNYSHFRWIAEEKDVTAFYQVSRSQFPANASQWQNQYIPGLVGSGPVKEYSVGPNGFHYFDINFAYPANHNPGDPPFYTGFLSLDEVKGGAGKPLAIAKVPGTSLGLTLKKIAIGPFSLGVPSGIVSVPAGELTEAEVGNPNENMLRVCSGCLFARPPTVIETGLLDMDRTYYVRVVPIRKDGTAGIPSLPVEVEVRRPEPCPPSPPPDTTQIVTVRPPSVKVASFYLQAFMRNDWIHTDQNGKLVSRTYYLSVTAPPGCDPAAEVQKSLFQQDPTCMQYIARTGGGQPNYHFFIDPPEGHWYDVFGDILTGLFAAFSSVINAVSAAWSNIQAVAVQIVADVIQAVSFNTIKCGDSDACKGVLQTGLSVAMTSLGVPPTVPNFAELESMGTGYLAKMAADQIGAGEVYGSLPDNVKNEMTGKAAEIGGEMAGSLKDTTATVTATVAGSWYIPDPLYYEPHPAFVIVNLYNPNGAPTDPVTMMVMDAQSLYKQTDDMYIPPLNPGESVSVPVILRERYDDVYVPGCEHDAYYSTCGGGVCIPCYWNLWYFKAKSDSDTKGPDQFLAVLTAKKDGFKILGLSPSSPGKVLNAQTIETYDDLGNRCTPSHWKAVLQYPAGWTMQKDPLTQDLMAVIWGKYTFTNGASGLLIGS